MYVVECILFKSLESVVFFLSICIQHIFSKFIIVSTKILSSTTVSSIDGNKKCFLSILE